MKKGYIMNKRGFTLVEIMVVVGIVGLLAGIASLAVLKGVRNARIKQAETELAMISAAVEQLVWDSGQWPNGRPRTSAGSAEMWNLSTKVCGLFGTNGTYKNWKGPYYDGAILDPWGNPYFFDPDYRVNGSDRVVVGSFGPNKVGQNRYDDDDLYVLLDD